MRVRQSTAARLSSAFYVDEETVTAATGDVTVTITRDDGTVVLTATPALAEDGVTYHLDLPPQPAPDILTARWSAEVAGQHVENVDQVEIVGGFYFAAHELRRTRKELEDRERFPTREIIRLREAFEDACEDFVGVPFVRRYRSERLPFARNSIALSTPYVRKIRSVRIGGTLVDPTTYTFEAGTVLFNRGLVIQSAGVAEVAYEWSATDHPTSELAEAARTAVRTWLLEARGPMSGRETTMNVEGYGTVNLGRSEVLRPTGLPAVDGLLLRLRNTYTFPGVA